MKLSKLITTLMTTGLMIAAINTASAAPGGNGGGNGGGNNGGGKEDEGPAGIVVTVDSLDVAISTSDPDATEISSHSVSSQGQAVFYNVMMDMTQFPGNLDSGPACDHSFRDGILVIQTKPKTGPVVAQLMFWFNSELESGDGVTHLLRMDGEFLDPQNWPPAPGTSTDVKFNSWDFSAENKKAQRQDCAGESDYPLSGLYFTVSQAEIIQ